MSKSFIKEGKMDNMLAHGLGWIPDLPDVRDYTEDTPGVRDILGPSGLGPGAARGRRPARLPAAVDLRPQDLRPTSLATT